MECRAGSGVDVAAGIFPRDLSGVTPRFFRSVTLPSSLLSSESDDDVMRRDLAAAAAGCVVMATTVLCRAASPSSSLDEDEDSESDDVIRWRVDLPAPVVNIRVESVEFLRPGSIDRDISSSLEPVTCWDLVALLRRRLVACTTNISASHYKHCHYQPINQSINQYKYLYSAKIDSLEDVT